MTYSLIVRPEAEADLLDARDWYESQRTGLGDEFLAAVDIVFAQIQETPRLHAAEYRAVRRVVLERFPYVVYYRLTGDAVEVFAVLHGSRHPRRWQSRT